MPGLIHDAPSVRTNEYEYDWIKVVRRNYLVLPVNGIVQFGRDGGHFYVFDAKRKKHKFALVGMRAILTK